MASGSTMAIFASWGRATPANRREGHEDDRVEDVYRAGVGGHGAGILASTCPFCRRNLDDARLAPGSQAEVLDVIEPADRVMDS